MSALDRHLSDCEAEAALDNAERFVKALVTAFDYLPDGFVASSELHIALLQANRLVVSLKRDLGLLPAVGRAA